MINDDASTIFADRWRCAWAVVGEAVRIKPSFDLGSVSRLVHDNADLRAEVERMRAVVEAARLYVTDEPSAGRFDRIVDALDALDAAKADLLACIEPLEVEAPRRLSQSRGGGDGGGAAQAPCQVVQERGLRLLVGPHAAHDARGGVVSRHTGACCSVCDAWYYYATRGGVPVEDDGVCWSCRRIHELRWLRFADAWQAIGMAALVTRILQLAPHAPGDDCAVCSIGYRFGYLMREAVS